MEDLSKYTKTELLKMANDIKTKHDALKQDIIADTIVMDELEKKVNEKIGVLTELEKNYVNIIEQIV